FHVEAQINAHFRIVGHNVCCDSTGDTTNINSDSLAPAVQPLELHNLVGQFDNRVTPLLWLYSRVCRLTVCTEFIPRTTFARADQITIFTCTFQYQHGLTSLAGLPDYFFAMACTDLFV